MAAGRSDKARSGRYVDGGAVEAYPTRIGWWERTVLATSVTDVTLTIESKYDKRPDLMSYDLYGRANLQWLILQYNNIVDINTEFVEGAQITLPTRARVFSELQIPQGTLKT